MDDTSPVEQYMIRFEKGLRIKDKDTCESIQEIVRSRITGQQKRSGSLEDLIREVGPPEKIARELSNPKNWIVDMGKPLNPGMDLDPILSKRSTYLLTFIFITALLLCASLLFITDIELAVVGVSVCFIGIWGLWISLIISFMAYLSTYERLRDSPINIEPVDRITFRTQLLFLSVGGTIIFLILGSVPLLLGSSGYLYTIILSISSSMALLTIGSYLIYQGNRLLSAPNPGDQ